MLSLKKKFNIYLGKLNSILLFVLNFILFPIIFLFSTYIIFENIGGITFFFKSILKTCFFIDLLTTDTAFYFFEKTITDFLNLFKAVWEAVDLALASLLAFISLVFRFCSFNINQPYNDFTKHKLLFLFLLIISIFIPINTYINFFDWWIQYIHPISKISGKEVYFAYALRVQAHIFLQILTFFCLMFCKSSIYTRIFIALMSIIFNLSLTNLTSFSYLIITRWDRVMDSDFSQLKEYINRFFTSCMEKNKR